jgi:orotate phosphoribosyltransferase
VSQSGTGIKATTMSQVERLARIFIETSFHSSEEPIYPLASGVLSRYYIDCKMALSYPEARKIVGELVFEKMRSIPFDAVGGLALGAYPIALAVSDAFYQHGITVRAFVVRKEPKVHGLGKFIEGDVRPGDRVLVVDDVITTGDSTIQAIRRCEENELNVVRAVALIDRQEFDGAQNISNSGVEFSALLTRENLSNLSSIPAQ